MSENLLAVILGIVQGLTEFLPVSSSGHIEIAKYFFGTDLGAEESILLTVVLHFGTAMSTVVVFWKDIGKLLRGLFEFKNNEHSRFTLAIIISMIPATAAALLMESQIEMMFSGEIILVAYMLIVTGLLLILADKTKPTATKVTNNNAFLVGIAQALAIAPGISRSGATIATSVILNIDREQAARFSFLMVVPLIVGKMILDLSSGSIADSETGWLALVLGFFVAFITGMLACKWMIILVKNAKLRYFSFYCFAVAIFLFVLEMI
ncbi:MAG: undecaprenyl-diphosphate phosphatase [Bacteroidia bacterium]|nr:undecaprenyl-diphosphate phosphatase [Bacteroidia bacterium]